MQELTLRECPVCASAISRWREKTTPHGRFDIDRCRQCGMAFVNPRPSLQFLSDFYTSMGVASHPGAHAPTLASVMEAERLSPNSTLDAAEMVGRILEQMSNRQARTPRRLLDVGSGFGFFTQQAMRSGFSVTALELGPARQITEEMTGVRPLPLLFEDYQAPEESYSAIVMSQVMEHVQDVNLWMQRAHRLLAPGGVIAIALPHFNSFIRRLLGSNDPFITPPEHLNFFTAASLRRLLSRHGFITSQAEYRSRIPRRAVERSIGRLGQFAVRPGILAGTALSATMDALGGGMMLRMYGTRPH